MMFYRDKTIAVLKKDGSITQKVIDNRIYLVVSFLTIFLLLLKHNDINVIVYIQKILINWG